MGMVHSAVARPEIPLKMRSRCLSTASVTSAKNSPSCEKAERIVSERKVWEMVDVYVCRPPSGFGFEIFFVIAWPVTSNDKLAVVDTGDWTQPFTFSS
jgi:hypothetical protein